MKIFHLAFTVIVGGLLMVPAALADTDIDAINQRLDNLHLDAARADYDSYFNHYTADAVFLGTDQSERWSIAEFQAYARPYFEAGQGWEYHPRERFIMGEGPLRWFDEVLWSDNYGYCRGTGVVVKTDAGWRVTHYSLTFLIPNEVAAEATALGMAARPDSVQP